MVLKVKSQNTRMGDLYAVIARGKNKGLKLYPHRCESAWNKDPVFGVIGIQTGPRG